MTCAVCHSIYQRLCMVPILSTWPTSPIVLIPIVHSPHPGTTGALERAATVSVAPMSPTWSRGGEEAAAHGLEAITEMLAQLVSLIASEATGTHADIDEFGLELMNAALNAGGSGACGVPYG